MKLLSLVLAFSTVPAMAANMNGYIGDSKCGAMHNGSAPNTACVKKCIDGGAKPVFVDDAKKNVYTIDNPDDIKAHYGHHVDVTAEVNDSAKTIHIAKVTMLPDQGKTAAGAMEMH
jgi:hypothetical protein